MKKQKFFLSLYKKAMKNFAGKGIQKYPLIKEIKNFIIEQAKSDFALIDGNKMFLGPKDSLGLSVNGVYEKLESDWVKNQIKKGDIVIDVGSNIGYYTLMFAKLVGDTGKVFSFEPEPFNFNLLQKNIEINKFSNVVSENTAIGNKVGTIKLYLSNLKTGMHRIYSSRFCTENFVEVKTTSLDEYFKNNEFMDKISLIKIDVEGSELGVLQGMEKIFYVNKKLKILIEYVPYSLRESGTEPRDLLKIIQDQGFRISHANKHSQAIEPVKDIDCLNTELDVDMFDALPKGTNLILER